MNLLRSLHFTNEIVSKKRGCEWKLSLTNIERVEDPITDKESSSALSFNRWFGFKFIAMTTHVIRWIKYGSISEVICCIYYYHKLIYFVLLYWNQGFVNVLLRQIFSQVGIFTYILCDSVMLFEKHISFFSQSWVIYSQLTTSRLGRYTWFFSV